MTESQLSDPYSDYYQQQQARQRQAQPKAPAQPSTYSDYYSAMNNLLQQGKTGAEAVALAAKMFPGTAPASARDYLAGAGAQYVQPQAVKQPAPKQQPATQGSGSPVSSNGTVVPGPAPTSVPMPTLPQAGSAPTRPSDTNLGAPVATPTGYAGSTFTQFMAPDTGTVAPQSQALMEAILAHPLTLSNEVVGALQAQQRDQAVQMAEQARAQLAQSAVGRGLTPGQSGFVASGNNAITQGMIDSILGGNRQIAIQKATQDRADQLAALQAAQDFQNAALNRATQGYGATLSGQQVQAAADQAAANSRLQGAQFDMAQQLARAQNAQQNYATDLGAYNANRQNNLQDFLAKLQAYMGQQGLNLDTAKLAETARQFNDQLGLGYDQLNQSGQNNLLNWLLMMNS